MKSASALVMSFAALMGCADSKVTTSDAPKSEAKSVVFNAAGAPTVMFSVPDMVCESCSAAVHETLAAQPGAREVTVDLEKKVATVAIDKETFDKDAAVAALLDKQFSHAQVMK